MEVAESHEIIVAKHRNGPVGTVNLHYDNMYSNNVGNRYNQINFITCSTAMLISLN
ncbi:hypothetical protein OTSGILL_0665 [Orientia tsutsugamushi str. Gilliam]|uniref:Replicative DNA helicase n=1 Tax=Orientia tsutsugamushi str. Gilliam TaxID=1359184 RepID=A0A0F3MDQ3_ORITS|nr:DnaB-like helicase C-terminal domain-containing protein [Orientia tsutsugamushi]KJV53592.1 hypothetical protein OTSGILL_0665 [Orientia tsutsugamushi str. Gilliam]SPR07745.1 replicative DNA helicase [Orientia tsutsugamushi str. Gilliam]